MKKSLKAATNRVKAEDAKIRKSFAKSIADKMTGDSFQNFALQLGIGTDTPFSAGTYGFNPVTRIRIKLEWMHRGSWLCGLAVDLPAEDMTRAGVSFKGEIDPAKIEELELAATTLNLSNDICDTVKWSRLYGGALAVMLIDGQDTKTPLRPDTVGKNAFRGLCVLDRWQVEPSLQDLVTEPGAAMGQPKFYSVSSDGPGLWGEKIHYSRCIRLEGLRLPWYQRMQENMWGLSVLERLYDRLLMFDSATTGIAQLLYKSYIRTYKIKDLKEAIAAGGAAAQGIIRQVEFMRRLQGQEGITLIDMEDEFSVLQSAAYAGMGEALVHIGQQVSGAIEVPLVRLFGQSPVGLNSTGESDLRNYYDGINKKQNRIITSITLLYRVVAKSLGMKLDNSFGIIFNPLWQLTDLEKSQIAASDTNTVLAAVDSGLVAPHTGLEELRQSGRTTQRWTNISDEELANSEELPLPPPELEPEGTEAGASEGEETKQGGKGKRSHDADRPSGKTIDFHGLTIHVENDVGSTRSGTAEDGTKWNVRFDVPYGYIDGIPGDDGDSLDCFVGRDLEANYVYVIAQNHLDGTHDENKIMFGFDSKEGAKRCYFDHYDRPEAFFQSIKAVPVDKFVDWVKERPRTAEQR